MKKLLTIISLMILLTSCSQSVPSASIVTTSFVTYDFARTLVGEEQVYLLMEPGQEAHGYEPTALDMRTIDQADYFIYTNDDMEPWVHDVLESLDNQDLIVINASEDVEMLAYDHDHDHDDHDHNDHDDHGHSHGTHDPHTWTSMRNAQTMVNTIASYLSDLDVEENKEALISDLQKLDQEYHEVFNQSSNKHLIFIGHFALGYLMEDYGMEYLALFESFSHESEPTIQQLQNVIDTINEEAVDVVFVEELSNLNIIQTIQEETGVETLELSASHNVSQEQFDEGITFVQIQQQNIRNLNEGLKIISDLLISLNNVTMNYQSIVAVDNVSFDIHRGDFLVIAGENGSGKSTLIKGILGLKELKSGQIAYPGIKKNRIGYLPQVTSIQKDFPASVLEVVLSGYANQLDSRFFYSKNQKQRALTNMKLLEIDHLASHSFKDLSGGQKQRVLLARALSATNDLLILDEPVASLDVNITQSLFEILGELNQQRQITIVMITHDVTNILSMSNKIVRLNNKLDFYGSPEDYRKRMQVLD